MNYIKTYILTCSYPLTFDFVKVLVRLHRETGFLKSLSFFCSISIKEYIVLDRYLKEVFVRLTGYYSGVH